MWVSDGIQAVNMGIRKVVAELGLLRSAVPALALVACLAAAACGTDGPNTNLTSSTGSAARTGTTRGVQPAPAGAIAPLCEELAGLGPVREGNDPHLTRHMGIEMIGVILTYAREHPDTYAGYWIDEERAGTIVLAFTDDPGPHRDAIMARRASPDDVSPVEPRQPVTGSTTVGESGFVIDVVQAKSSEAELNRVKDAAATAVPPKDSHLVSYGVSPALNRVAFTFDEADGDARRLLAEHLPVDAICVHGPAVAAWPPGIPEPTTLIPAEGSDPYVTCSLTNLPFRRSVLDNPTKLADDDPLMVAFREVVSQTPGLAAGPEGDWYLLARTEDTATFALGNPPTASLSLRRRGGNWTAGLGSVGGASCKPKALSPPGFGPAEWRLDPAFPAPGPADNQIHVLVNETTCSSGQPIGDRLRGPEIRETAGQVLIGLAVRSPRGSSHTCIGTPAEPLAIDLPGPLGNRGIADGTFVPPEPVT